MTAAIAFEDSEVAPTTNQQFRLAKFSAWYLLVAGVLHFVFQLFLGYRSQQGVLGFFYTLTFGTEPTDGLPYGVRWLDGLVYLLPLGLGLIFVLAKLRVGARIVYGVYAALFLYAFFNLLSYGGYYGESYVALVRANGFSSIRGQTYMWLAVELLGFAIAAAAVIAIYVGMRHAPLRTAEATSATAVAAREQQAQEWRIAEVKKWQEAYSLANNGEAPPAGFVPPISAPPSQQRGTNVLAILALVFGLGGGLLGIIFGHISLSQIKRTGEAGRGMAIAGLVLGYIGLTLLIVWVVFILILANESSY